MSSQLVVRQKREFATRQSMYGAYNIFGTIGTGPFNVLSKMDFIPLDGSGHTLKLTGSGDDPKPHWVGLDSPLMQFWAYVYCSPLAAVIDRLAEADTNGILTFIDTDDNTPIKNVNKVPRLARIKKLLKNPNPWQTWEEFDGEQAVLCKIFGYCPVWAIGGDRLDRSTASALVNLNRLFATPIRNDNFDIFKRDSPILRWDLKIFNNNYEIDSKDVFIVKDGFVANRDELGLPISKINGLDFFVSNICAAMEADNVLLKKKGPLGVFSYDPGKDMAGAVPLDPKAKDELQKDLMQYGLTLGQLQYVISKMPVKWNAMSFSVRDLMTKETIRAGIDGICDRFGYPAELMSGKNATYENRNSSEKWLYNNNVIPVSTRKMCKYNEFFSLEDGVSLTKRFSHLPVLQEDIVRAGEAYQYTADGLQVEWTSGMITWNQWQIKQEREPVAGMDIYYPDYIKKYPEMNINKPVSNGATETAPKNSGTKK